MHIAITSINFDKSPEGICTGLLIRALLESGVKVTLITSKKAKLGFTHSKFKCVVVDHAPREPRALIRMWAAMKGEFFHPFYFWAKNASKVEFDLDDVPDIFYGRAWPFSSLIPAFELSKRYSKPLVLHLSDPIPPPNESLQKSYLVQLKLMLDQASAITFTNEETVSYQSKFLDYGDKKVMVLPHVGPERTFLPAPSVQDQYYYIGAIGNRESVLPILFGAMHGHRKLYPSSNLNFINPSEKQIAPHIGRQNARSFVHCHPFLPDINDAFGPAGALVSLEPEVSLPIWTLTKTVHYLFTNRKILAVTSPGSPTQSMLSNFPESCVVVTEYSARSIALGLNQLRELEPTSEDFSRRYEAMAEFRGENVAQKLVNLCSTLKAPH